MSLNGSGVFIVNSAGQPVVASTLITAAAFNAFTADVAAALSTAIYKDGQQTVTANIPMGGYKLTGLAAGSAAGDSVRYEQVQPIDATLTSLATLGTAADKYAYTTGVDTWAEGSITAAGRAILDDANAAAQRSTLGAAASGANSDITSLAGLTTSLSVGQGGTGAATLTANNVLLGNGTAALQVVAPGTSGNVLTSNGTTWQSTASANMRYAKIQDEKTLGTAGGTFTAGAWRTRDLNTIVSDPQSIVSSLTANAFTLAAGTYYVRISAPAYKVDAHQVLLRNITDGSSAITQSSAFSSPAASTIMNRAETSGIFTIAASKTFELWHQCGTTYATSGFGVAGSLSAETYSIVEIWKIT